MISIGLFFNFVLMIFQTSTSLALSGFSDKRILPEKCYSTLNKAMQSQIQLSIIDELPNKILEKKFSSNKKNWVAKTETDWAGKRAPSLSRLYISRTIDKKITQIELKEMYSSVSTEWKSETRLYISVFLGTKASAEMLFDTETNSWISQKLHFYFENECN